MKWSSSNKRQPLTKLGVEPSNHYQKVLVGSQEFGMLIAEQSRNHIPASYSSPNYVWSAHTCFVRCKIDSELPILDV
jgi:hypothetical protein